MPPAPVDFDRLRSLGAALGPLRECAREGAEEVLAQFPELGDRETQTALDAWVEELADLLREVDASASDVADRLRVSALAVPAGAERSAFGAEASAPGTEPSSAPADDRAAPPWGSR